MFHCQKLRPLALAHPNKEGLDHAVGLSALHLTTIRIEGCLDDFYNVITELQLKCKSRK